MSEAFLNELLRKHLDEFQQHDAESARKVQKTLKKCPKALPNEELIHWWKQQDLTSIAALQSYMFWMWTTKKIEYQVFANAYETLTPVQAKSWHMPIEITTGQDSPLFEGGFLSHEFSVFQFKFSPSNNGLEVMCQEYPATRGATQNLDLLLDFLSFLLVKYNYGQLGFRKLQSRKWQSSERAAIAASLGPEVRRDVLDFDFRQIEQILPKLEIKADMQAGFSLVELLKIRHRAILDSSLESKLVTLWSALESQWGDEEKNDRLFTEDETTGIENALSFLTEERRRKIIEKIGQLKSKTKNERIAEEVEKLECAKGWEAKRMPQAIHSLRSKIVHGGSFTQEQLLEVEAAVMFMMQIFNELISKKFSDTRIIFAVPKPSQV